MNNVDEAVDKMSKKELGDVKVLMIEDDPYITDLVLQKLSGSGCIPYSTGDGGEALKLAKQYQPNVVILDLMLPNHSGEEILKEMRADDELKSTPVIVFSNKSESADIETVKKLGIKDYFIKSSTELSQLAEAVKKAASK